MTLDFSSFTFELLKVYNAALAQPSFLSTLWILFPNLSCLVTFTFDSSIT